MKRRSFAPWTRHLSVASRWHRSDPRVRLALSVLLSAAALSSRGPAEIVFVYGTVAVLYLSSRTGPGTARRGLRSFLVLLIFTAVLQVFFTPGRPLPPLGPLRLPGTVEGVRLAALIMARLAAVILVSTHLVCTTSPVELSRSLGWFFSPLKRLGVPLDDLVLILNLGFQFFPVLLEESHRLRLSLESRGISFRHPRLSFRLRAVTAWVLALLTGTFERSHRIALALELKGFGEETPVRFRFRSERGDTLLMLGFLAACTMAWLIVRMSVR